MGKTDKISYKAKSAVLFIVFNRPDSTHKVFDQIRKARPSRLYVAADGPRFDQEGEEQLCKKTRSIVDKLDWDCEIHTLFRDKNLGCKKAVSSAINWFFNHEEEGIILEDDCLPSDSFFGFCDILLDKYRNDARVRHISGCNFQQGQKWGDSTYYFSNISHVWGWATWKRVWNEYDLTLSGYSRHDVKRQFGNIYNDPMIIESWDEIFSQVKAGQINSWAYPLGFMNYFNNGLCIIPNENLVSNIGFGENATHTQNQDSLNANIPLHEITEIKHPIYFVPEKQADEFSLSYEFNIAEKKRKQQLLRRRIKKWFKSLFVNHHVVHETHSQVSSV
jgi:hypothetical protein